MLRITIATVLGNDQTVVLSEVLDLFAIRCPQTRPAMNENKSLLGCRINVEVCELETTNDGFGFGWISSVCCWALYVELLLLVNEWVEVSCSSKRQ